MAARNGGPHAVEHAGTVTRTAAISAEAVRLSLRDLTDKAAKLPPGDLRRTWTAAAAQMIQIFEDAQAAAALRRIDRMEVR